MARISYKGNIRAGSSHVYEGKIEIESVKDYDDKQVYIKEWVGGSCCNNSIVIPIRVLPRLITMLQKVQKSKRRTEDA